MLEQRISLKDKHRPGSFIDQGNNEAKLQVLWVLTRASVSTLRIMENDHDFRRKLFSWCQRTREEKCLAFNLTFMSFTWFLLICFVFCCDKLRKTNSGGQKEMPSYMTMAPLPKKSQRITAEVVRIARELLTSRLYCRGIRHTSIVTWEFQLNRLPNVSWIIFDGICVRSNKASINCDVGCLEHLMKYHHYGS